MPHPTAFRLAVLALAGTAIAVPFVFEFIRQSLSLFPPSRWTWLIGGLIASVDMTPLDRLFQDKESTAGMFTIYALYFSVLYICYQTLTLATEEYHHNHYSGESWQKTLGLVLKYLFVIVPITLNPLISWMIARGLTYRYLVTFACNFEELILLPDMAGCLLACCVYGITVDFYNDYLVEVRRITSHLS